MSTPTSPDPNSNSMQITRRDVDMVLREDAMTAIECVEKLYAKRGAIMGLSTGFTRLDLLSSGLLPGRLYVIASRPSMGKSSLVLNIVEHVAVELRKAVGIFTLEMNRRDIVQRLLCSRARVSVSRIQDGFISDRDFPNLCAAATTIAEGCPILIDDTPTLTMGELRNKTAQMHEAAAEAGGLSLIVVDYLQLMRSTVKRAQETRYAEVSEISGELKALSKEMNIPIIVLSQLNRGPENRVAGNYGRPFLNDLRDSGCIEDDADFVALLTRPEYYAADEEEKEELAGIAELIVAKNRNGYTGVIKMRFDSQYTRFANVEP